MGTKPFLISAVIGNSRLLLTLSPDGQMQRLFWPHVDGPQHVERLVWGLSVDGGPVAWQDGPGWQHTQDYETDQNILVTRSRREPGVMVTATDAAVPGRDLLVRQMRFRNTGTRPVGLRFVIYQWLRVDENPRYNSLLFDEVSDALVHYRRDMYIGLGSDRSISDLTVGRIPEIAPQAETLALTGPRVRHGDVGGIALWDLGELLPGDEQNLCLFWALGRRIADVRALLDRARAAGGEKLLAETRAYWHEWLQRAVLLQVPEAAAQERVPALPGVPAQVSPAADVLSLYRRSLLVLKLMCDEETGAVIAAPEVDSDFNHCGGYAYCWGRDAAYAVAALDLAGYHDLAGAFYRWAVQSQEPEGWWAHRHMATGDWGPSWGLLQVDETGSILWGMGLHARLYGGEAFMREVWPSVSRAAAWLIHHLDPETGLPLPSFDLWEERQAESAYSAAAVYGGLSAAAEMAAALALHAEAERYRHAADGLRAAILHALVRDGRFLRSRRLTVTEAVYREAVAAGRTGRAQPGLKGHFIYELEDDPTPDLSLLGISLPFGAVATDHPVMQETARHLVASLWAAPGGGMLRYLGDGYRGGNPWVLGALWLGLYFAKRGDSEGARAMLDWAIARQSSTGLLAEQVDAETGEPVWILPLAWSHAMYVFLALQLFARESAQTTSGGGRGASVSAGSVPESGWAGVRAAPF